MLYGFNKSVITEMIKKSLQTTQKEKLNFSEFTSTTWLPHKYKEIKSNSIALKTFLFLSIAK